MEQWDLESKIKGLVSQECKSLFWQAKWMYPRLYRVSQEC
jgi:hypothetical protein